MNNLIELNGKYTDAKMFINTVDEGTIGQVTTMINEPVTDGGIVRIMPMHIMVKALQLVQRFIIQTVLNELYPLLLV